MSRAASCDRHVGQQPAVALLAVRRVAFRPADEGLLRGRAGRDVVRPYAGEEGRVTGQGGGAGTHPARVEADDVVVGGHLRAEPVRDVRREAEAAAARAARVDQQVALLLAGWRGGRHPGQRQGDHAAARTRVVQRHPEAGALQARHPRPSRNASAAPDAGPEEPAPGRRGRETRSWPRPRRAARHGEQGGGRRRPAAASQAGRARRGGRDPAGPVIRRSDGMTAILPDLRPARPAVAGRLPGGRPGPAAAALGSGGLLPLLLRAGPAGTPR